MSGYSALSLQDYIRSRHPASLPPSLSHTAYTQQYIRSGRHSNQSSKNI